MENDLIHLEKRYLHRSDLSGLTLNTKSKLLEAAVTMFAKHGFDGTSLRQISNFAGVKHGSIQYHYESKESLWRATVDFLYGLLIEATKQDEAVGKNIGTPIEVRQHMIAMTRAYIRFSSRYPELFRILTYETMHESSRLDWIVDNYSKPFAEKSMRRIDQAKAAGVYPEHVANLNLYYISMAACRTIFLLAPEVKRTFGSDVFDEDILRQHEDAVIELIYR